MSILASLIFLATALQAAAPAPASTAELQGPPRQAARPATLPIICYHRFGEESQSDELKISAKRLAEQLRWLKREGYQSITLKQARDFVEGRHEQLPAKPIILSVDDGYTSGWTVGGPVFKKYGFKAVYFVIADQVGATKTFLNWETLREIFAQGFEVQSHTCNHSNLGRPLRYRIPLEGGGHPEEFKEKFISKFETPLDYQTRLRNELESSRRKIEEKLEISVKSLAYPFGAFNPVVESYAVDAGYDMAMSVSGGVNIPGDNPLRLRRIIIVGHPTLASFQKKVMEQRLDADVEGLEEGSGFHPYELPHKVLIRMPAGRASEMPRAELQGGWVTLQKEEGEGAWSLTLRKEIKPGFYFCKIESGGGPSFAKDNYLFQIYRPGMQAHMVPLSPTSGITP
jgi:peptidoglycan/xylan/chitin deacetylase (PgdA/CDA1 family)